MCIFKALSWLSDWNFPFWLQGISSTLILVRTELVISIGNGSISDFGDLTDDLEMSNHEPSSEQLCTRMFEGLRNQGVQCCHGKKSSKRGLQRVAKGLPGLNETQQGTSRFISSRALQHSKNVRWLIAQRFRSERVRGSLYLVPHEIMLNANGGRYGGHHPQAVTTILHFSSYSHYMHLCSLLLFCFPIDSRTLLIILLNLLYVLYKVLIYTALIASLFFLPITYLL